jgi:ketosteroid isomerase-like protein
MSETQLAAAQRLYDAFDAHDGPALLEAMSPSFRGVVSAGMPRGLGGVYDGPERMLGECWGPVLAALHTRPVPDEYIPAGADRMVVTGHYVGHARETGRRLDAAFAHVLRFEDGRVSELVQITDTARWHEALRP